MNPHTQTLSCGIMRSMWYTCIRQTNNKCQAEPKKFCCFFRGRRGSREMKHQISSWRLKKATTMKFFQLLNLEQMVLLVELLGWHLCYYVTDRNFASLYASTDSLQVTVQPGLGYKRHASQSICQHWKTLCFIINIRVTGVEWIN